MLCEHGGGLAQPLAAEDRSRESAETYAENSQWDWEALSGRLLCEPHPKLPCLLEPSALQRGDRWVPCWVLFAGQDLPGWRFYQWVSARNDDSPPLSMEEAPEVLERTIADFLFMVERLEAASGGAIGPG